MEVSKINYPDYIILGCLTLGEMSGYQLKRLIGKSAAFFTPVSYGSIYPSLKKLEMNHLVVSQETVKNGRLIKTYSITEEGRNVLIAWLKTALKPDIFRSDILIRLFFDKDLLSKEDLESFISDYIQMQQAAHDEFSKMHDDINEKIDAYQRYTLKFAIDHRRFLMEWYQKLLQELKAQRTDSEAQS